MCRHSTTNKAILLKELSKVTDWRMLGAYLNVPVHVLDKVNIEHDGVVEHCVHAAVLAEYYHDCIVE